MTLVVSPPTRVAAVEKDLTFTREWRNYLLDLQNIASGAAQILKETSLLSQSANIVTTPIPLPAVAAGYYRISVYQAVTVVDAVNSSLIVTLGWVDQALSKVYAGPAMTGNLLSTALPFSVPIHIDNASPITYAATYASNTPGAMKFDLGILFEKM